jgi:hypothetical protein
MATGTKTAAATTDAISEFFEELAGRGDEPLLGHTSGSISFDIGEGRNAEYWRVDIKKGGDVSVSRKRGQTDAWIRADRDCVDRIVQGRENVITAMLREVIQVGGDLGLLMQFQKLFPGPPPAQYRAKIKAKVTR